MLKQVTKLWTKISTEITLTPTDESKKKVFTSVGKKNESNVIFQTTVIWMKLGSKYNPSNLLDFG